MHPIVEDLRLETDKVTLKRDSINDDLKEVTSYPLPTWMFVDTSHRLKEVINPDDGCKPIRSNNRTHKIVLKSPVFVDDVVIKTSNYYSYHAFEFLFLLGGSLINKIDVKLDKDKNEFAVKIGRIVDLIEFKTPRSYYKNPVIELIAINGIEIERIDEIENIFSSVRSVAEDIEERLAVCSQDYSVYIDGYNKKHSELEDVESEIDKRNESINSLGIEEKSVRDSLNSLMNEQALLNDDIKSKRIEQEELERACHEKEERFRQLAKDIAVNESRLSELKSDINLFPSELSDFAKEGGDSIKRYLLVSLIPMLVVMFMSIHLYVSSSDLAVEYFTKYKDLNVFEVVLSRSPYVILSFVIISICSKLIYNFVGEAIRITNQRLSLSKVSIVAKDVSDSSCTRLGLSDDEIYEKRTALKMELLREHLKLYISEDYKYNEKGLGDGVDVGESDELNESDKIE